MLIVRWTLKKSVQKGVIEKKTLKKNIEKKNSFFFMKKTARLEKKNDHSTSEMKKPKDMIHMKLDVA